VRFYHCRRCKQCIYMMDHHCEWVSNCIGFFNFKVYLHLLINVLLNSLFSIIITIINYSLLFTTKTYIFLFLFTFLPALYVVFESARLINDAYQALTHNQTLIESFKHVKGPSIDLRSNLIRHFGSDPNLSWLVPTFLDKKDGYLLEEKMTNLLE